MCWAGTLFSRKREEGAPLHARAASTRAPAGSVAEREAMVAGAALTAIAAVLAIWAAVRHRSWRPVALVVAAFGLIVTLTEPLKWLLDRPAPHAVVSTGVSYPSGHAVNAVVWYA